MVKIADIVNSENGTSVSRFLALSRAWRAATTENIIAVTTPIKLENDKLFISVHDNIWLTELNYMKKDIVKRLEGVGVKIKDIDFKYSPIYFKVSKKKQPTLPITDIERVYIDKLSKNLENDKLKSAYKSALNAYFTRYTFDEFMNR